MFNKISLSFAFILLLLWTPFAFAEPNMQEGKWEITMKMDMQGMPMAMPPMKHTQCLTKKDMVPQKQEKNRDCKIISSKISGDTLTWVMQCSDKNGTHESNGRITYKGNSFDGVINMTITEPKHGKSKITQHISGKRIGDCK